MRANSLNLKKKIAFIASFAMLASSIPAFSLSASADTGTYVNSKAGNPSGFAWDTAEHTETLTGTYPDLTEEASKSATALEQIQYKAVTTTIDTFKAYVKVGNKYLGYDTSAKTPVLLDTADQTKLGSKTVAALDIATAKANDGETFQTATGQKFDLLATAGASANTASFQDYYSWY